MNAYFITAGILCLLLGLTHSIMGERYFLPRLYKPVLPFHLGSELFINRTLRTAWHWITIAWLSVAILLFYLSRHPLDASLRGVCWFIIAWMVVSAFLSFVISRGRHLSWLILLVSAFLVFLGL